MRVERYLVVLPGADPQDAVARGLRFLGDDGQLLADEVVQEGALARVGAPDDGHVAWRKGAGLGFKV